ncbi:MAG: hypothetical protein JJE12_00730 [Anaerolineales bacterium]|nr:hypothetical protein [Anaerolineales bacterium]
MNQSKNLHETQLEIWFSSMRAVIPRAPDAIQRGRRDFLAQVSALAAPVSKLENQRHTGWIASFVNTLTTKEYSPMYTTIASFILVLALMFGGSGAAVLAAQDSLPNQSLYQVKTFAEDLALRSTFRNEHRIQMELDYAGRRVTEMTHLREMQQEIPESAYLRLEKHLDQALLIAAKSEAEEMARSLNQIRERLQNQNASLSPDHDPLMIRIREMIQTRISWAELGLDDPLVFQQQAQVRTQFNQQAQFEHQYGLGPGPDLDPEPGVGGFGPGPQQPEPNNPECQGENCDPAAQNHNGPGQEAEEKHQYGPGPDNQSAQDNENPDPGQPAPGGKSPEPSPGSNQDQETGQNGQDSSSNPESSQGSGSNKGNGGTP